MSEQFANARILCKIDHQSGYHQIRLRPESVPLTALNTRYWYFEFLVLLFGLIPALATFYDLMNSHFIQYLDLFVIIYLDDILIYNDNQSNHINIYGKP